MGNATPDKFGNQLLIRDEIIVGLGLSHIRAAGIVCGHQVVGNGNGIILADPAHHQTGKNMGTNHRVIMPRLQGSVQLLRPKGEGLIYHRGILWRGIVIFCHAVACVKQQGRPLINPDMPVADEFGKLRRQKGQTVGQLTVNATGSQDFCNGFGSGIMPLAGIARQNENAHGWTCSSL